MVLLVSHLYPRSARGEDGNSWYLPTELSTKNTEVRFELDSTWHTVYGRLKTLSGRVSLEDSKDPSSARFELSFPVSSFDTDNGSRDEEMREVMAAAKFPDVTFRSSGGRLTCTPQAVKASGSCEDKLSGVLTIRGMSKLVEIPVRIQTSGTGYEVSGRLPIRWGEFGVEDPSILVAKVAPIVSVIFRVELNPITGE